MNNLLFGLKNPNYSFKRKLYIGSIHQQVKINGLKKFFNKMKFFFILFLALIIVFTAYTQINKIRINKINCKNQIGECSNKIVEKISKYNNCNFFNCFKNLKVVLENMVLIDSYDIKYRLPSEIDINIIEKNSVASIFSKEDNTFSLIDSNGMVLKKEESYQLPYVIINEKSKRVGEMINQEEYFSINIIRGIIKVQEIDSAEIIGNHLEVNLKNGKKILFPLEGDRDFLLGAFTLILNELKKNETGVNVGIQNVDTIDLRFKNPVLK